jgi:hypothetical protein
VKPADDWHTLRELDREAGTVKGSAFRAFKALASTLREDDDYRVLDAVADASTIAGLRAAGRLYDSSVRVILLAPAAARRVAAALAAESTVIRR